MHLLSDDPAQPLIARRTEDEIHSVALAPVHQLVAAETWSDETLLEEVRKQVLPAMQKQGPVVAWIVEDTGFPKKGKHSVGVARQYRGQVGKQENCRATGA